MLFLRITPTLPNTFINMASPIVGIPYGTFLSATILGLIPATFISVRVSSPTSNCVLHLWFLPSVTILFPVLMGLGSNDLGCTHDPLNMKEIVSCSVLLVSGEEWQVCIWNDFLRFAVMNNSSPEQALCILAVQELWPLGIFVVTQIWQNMIGFMWDNCRQALH